MLGLFITCLLSFQSGVEPIPPASTLISALPSRCLGPVDVGARVGPIAVYEKNPLIFYFASCNGGVMKTTDGGKQFGFIFDKVGSCSIGNLAISQKNPDVLWVGTGDKWQRNSVGMGDGIYKTLDGGKTWQDMGLKKSVSISKIVIDPTNEDIVMVAVLGSPWGYGPDRGIYKTKDGGKSWKKVLYTDEKSAGTDVVIDPKNPKNMLAALWDHIHYPYGWHYGGQGSGIYKSTDGGETWRKVTRGLPSGKLGRIALDIFRKDTQQVVAAIEEENGSGLYRSWDGGESWKMMPALKPDGTKHTGIWGRPYYDLDILFDPLDSNKIYFNSFQRTTDGGKTADSGGGDVHGCWIDPNNTSHGFALGDVRFYESWDLDKKNLYGPGTRTYKLKFPSVFQTYGVGYDMRKLYWVMGNSQDESHAYTIPTQTVGWLSGDQGFAIPGDECGRSMADPEDWTTIYVQHRCGALDRMSLKTGESKRVSPGWWSKRTDPKKMRAGWNSGFQISPWSSKTLYVCANVLLKSVDQGDHWETISPDLTHNNPALWAPDEETAYSAHETGPPDINRAYQTIFTVCESPAKPGVIWCGTDDGYVQLTKDGGKTWENVTKNIPGLPDYSWCSRIEASRFSEGRAYVTFDNHRNFDLKSYVYVTEDYGQTWAKITGNLPDEPCRVIKEGLKNPDLLFLGTEFGLWISLDRGKSWDYYQDWNCTGESDYFPRVAIHDLQIQPRELDLIIAAHGRGIWTMPIRPLEEMTKENRAKDVYFTQPGNVYLFLNVKAMERDLVQYTKSTQPGTLFSYYLKHNAKSASIKIQDAKGEDLIKGEGRRASKIEITGPAKAGLNSIQWMNEGAIKKPGDYRAVLTIDGKEYYQVLHVEDVTKEVLAGMQAKYPKIREEIADNRD